MHGRLILCPEDTDWAMSPETFAAKLQERWRRVKIEPESDIPGIVIMWDAADDGVALNGHFDEDGLTVGFRGPEGHASFACWYRSLVPPEVPLIMMDADYSEVHPLTPETTPDDILSSRIVLRPPPDPRVLFSKRTR